jgi:signal transduction histidine kinase
VVDRAADQTSLDQSVGLVDVLVARDGTPCLPPPPAQVSTPVRGDGIVLAWIRHGPAAADVARLAATLDGPARLAFAVERLEAVSAAQSRHIAASRTRIVESGEEERRRLERDIHDGAQQQMLSLGMQIEMALIDLEPRAASRPVLEVSLARVRDALGELRGIAHGLRPFPLEVAGLDTALHALARRSDTPVIVGPLPRRRLGNEVESTVLALVQSVVACADGPVDVGVTEHESTVELSISGLSPSVINGLVADRVASVGGSLRSGSNEVTAVIPCAP